MTGTTRTKEREKQSPHYTTTPATRHRLNIPLLRQTKPNLVDWEKDMSR